MGCPWYRLKPARLGHEAWRRSLVAPARCSPLAEGSFTRSSTARTAQGLFGYVQTDQARCRQ